MEWIVVGAALFGISAICLSRQLKSVTDAINSPVPLLTASVVIPAFDEEDYIEPILTALKQQTVTPDEIIIVVDQRSSDATADIAAKNGARVVYSAPGKLTAKNTGASYAQGDLIVFLDADVDIGPNLLQLLLRHFTEEDILGVGGSVLQGTMIEQLVASMRNAFYFPLVRELVGNVTAVRKDAFFAVGGYDESINQIGRFAVLFEEEFNLGVRLQQYGRVIVDPDAVVFLSRSVAPTRQKGDCTDLYSQQVEQRLRF